MRKIIALIIHCRNKSVITQEVSHKKIHKCTILIAILRIRHMYYRKPEVSLL